MKIKVNKDKCISCGTCIVLAEASFKWDEDGKAVEIVPPGDDEQTIRDAASACPVGAIEIE
ncbi:MAG: ferredoxin [Candidatus Magasanikiibacteriota bacterium]